MRAQQKFVLLMGRQNQHDKARKMHACKEVLGDITSSVDDKNADKKVMKSIKNLMSECCIVQKKFNEILQTYRQSILPEVVEEWDNI